MRRMRTKFLSSLLVVLVGCSVIAVTFLYALAQTEEARSKQALPQWTIWESRLFEVDLDGDGFLETVTLSDKTLHIADGARGSGASLPEGRYTSDVFVQDIDLDGTQEIVTLTWKKGSFGPYRPFWHTEPDNALTEHIFIFTYENGELKDKWLSSDIRIEVVSLVPDAWGRMDATLRDGSHKTIEWQDWGLSFLDKNTPSYNAANYDAASVIVMGDVIAHNSILKQGSKTVVSDGQNSFASDSAARPQSDHFDRAYDFSFLFENIAPLVQHADVAIVNQEGPLVTDRNQVSGEFMVFGTPYQMIRAYKDAGFDVIALANNHALDRGNEGFLGTMEIVQDAGLEPAGFGPIVIQRNNIDIGILNVTALMNGTVPSSVERGTADFDQGDFPEAKDSDYGTGDESIALQESFSRQAQVQTLYDSASVLADVQMLHEQTDFVLCYLHAGEEYRTEPTDADRALIARFVDAGADAVVCSHAHVTQPIERVVTSQGKSAVVFYGLGNLVSNQREPGTQEGLCAYFDLVKPKDDPLARAHIATYVSIPTTCIMISDKTTVYLSGEYSER